jgi:hypothetical protein
VSLRCGRHVILLQPHAAGNAVQPTAPLLTADAIAPRCVYLCCWVPLHTFTTHNSTTDSQTAEKSRSKPRAQASSLKRRRTNPCTLDYVCTAPNSFLLAPTGSSARLHCCFLGLVRGLGQLRIALNSFGKLFNAKVAPSPDEKVLKLQVGIFIVMRQVAVLTEFQIALCCLQSSI